MQKTYQQLLNEFYQLIDSQIFDASALDYRILDRHIRMLETINVVQDSAISIFDMYRKKHVFISSQFETMLGWDIKEAHEQGTQYMDERLHPEDAMRLTQAGIYFMRMAYALAGEDRKKLPNYKVITDYRTKDKTGNYIRVIEQQKALELDLSGNVWLALSVLDVSPDKDIQTPARSRLINTLTGDLYLFPPEETDNTQPKLSGREQEILSLIASGLVSKQIADKLFISINTVNTHRQRIIEKLEVSNTFEAIQYASELGLINPIKRS
jgi:DNA-binding CsgD family transcriptional regulator